MKWPTTAGIPSRADLYTQLNDHLIQCQELCAMLGHLHKTETSAMDATLAHGWYAIAELLRNMQLRVTQLAAGRLN